MPYSSSLDFSVEIAAPDADLPYFLKISAKLEHSCTNFVNCSFSVIIALFYYINVKIRTDGCIQFYSRPNR